MKCFLYLRILFFTSILLHTQSLSAQWTQLGTDIDGQAVGDVFGSNVSISSDGSRIAVVAPGHDGLKGTVQIYEFSSGTWTQLGADIDGQVANDVLNSVSLSSDGTRVAIGAIFHDGTGTMQIYEFSSGTWTQLGTDIDGQAIGDRFGISVSLSSDGNRVAIGAPDHDGDKGTVQIYEFIGGTWTQLGTDIDGQESGEFSGFRASLSSDGSRVAIGAGGHDANKGTTRMYEFIGGSWIQLGADIDGQTTGDRSGWSVSLSSDGSRVAIGATFHDGKGTTQIYEFSGGTWTQLGNDIDGQAIGDRFGYSVSLSSDGSRVAIGDDNHDGKGTTQIYEFRNGIWTQLADDIDGQTTGDRSGSSVSLSSDGSRVIIGAANHDGLKGTVQIYEGFLPEINKIPTLSEWGLIFLALFLLIIGVIRIRQIKHLKLSDN